MWRPPLLAERSNLDLFKIALSHLWLRQLRGRLCYCAACVELERRSGVPR